MKVINPSVEIMTLMNPYDVYKHIEYCGRVCYKSEGNITADSHIPFIKKIINSGHEAVLEHFDITLKFICDRGVSHEIVRHRLASYCQESTRYCNYAGDDFGNEITVIKPFMLTEDTISYNIWKAGCEYAESCYFAMLSENCSPQVARSVLPNSLKTEVVMTANIREWRHFFKLRCAPAAHPQMREVAMDAFRQLYAKIPLFFIDMDAML